jgi:hypothetical protein
MGSFSETAGKKNRNNFQQRRRYLAPATLDTSTVHKQQNLSVRRCFDTASRNKNRSVLGLDARPRRSAVVKSTSFTLSSSCVAVTAVG